MLSPTPLTTSGPDEAPCRVTTPARLTPLGWISRQLFHLGLDLSFLALFIVLLAILCAIYGAPPVVKHGSSFLPLVVAGLLILVAFGTRLRRLLRSDRQARAELIGLSLAMLRDWLPLVLLLLVYDNFHDLTHVIRPHVVDASLRHADELLLGATPAVWLQRITRPWLTEYMTFAYALFFFFPTLILGLLYARGDFIRFREFALALSLCYYLGLIGYMTVPAVGPRYMMADALQVPLSGYWLTEPARRAWRSIETVDRDCFPSLHTAMSTIALVYLWRLRARWRGGRWLLAVNAPLIVSLWFSTLYLRYHYAVDVIAGWLLAFLCVWAAPRLTRWYYRGRATRTPLAPTPALGYRRLPAACRPSEATMSSEGRITTERRGHLFLIGIDRVAKRNSFTWSMLQQLAHAFTALEDDREARVGVLYAHGDHFTAGLDLAEVAPHIAEGATLSPEGEVDPLGVRGRARTKPVVAAVQGRCLTLGIELVLAQDITVAADDVRFAQIEIKRGIFPFGGATLRWPLRSGWGNAMRWLLTGDELGAAEALRIGLVQEVVPPGQQLERALAIAERVAAQAPLGVQATIVSARRALVDGFDAAATALGPELGRLMASADAREGMMSFLERRDGRFTGE